jgi:hypothetical protein
MNHFQSNGPNLKNIEIPIYIYNIFTIFTIYILDSFGPKNVGLSFQPSRNIIKWKWNGKIKPCPPIKSCPLSYGSGFSLSKKIILRLLLK